MIWPLHRRDWLISRHPARSLDQADPLGDDLRAAVTELARCEADNIRCYETRVQSLVAEIVATVTAPVPADLPR